MDTFFLSHGSPTLSIDERLQARHFMQSWRDQVLPEVPKAILMVSGHWDVSDPTVNVINGPNDTIYDFYGFPKSMYQVIIIPSLYSSYAPLFPVLVFSLFPSFSVKTRYFFLVPSNNNNKNLLFFTDWSLPGCIKSCDPLILEDL